MNERRERGVPPARTAPPTPGAEGDDRDEIRELVRRTLAGDDDAYAEIFRRFRDKVYRISYRFARNPDDAMDLTQTVFIKTHRSLASYREESAFATWIARVATNCGIDWVRAKKREAQVQLDDAMDLGDQAAGAASPDSPRLGPAASALNAELGTAIRHALEGLSEKHRTVFVLHCVDGMPYQQIADTVGISIGTVMSRLFHARRYLRKALEPYLGESRVRALLRDADAAAVARSARREES